ncbi:MAG: TonB-dependent receptor [Bacteroidales bacterium]|nr:TonB-dependent receptor [Bacteroidales bacterium]
MARYVVSLLLLTFVFTQGWSQSGNITAKGTVVDTAGLPLAGVTVMISGTNKATLTDANGNFTIECPANSTLKFSYIGYKTVELASNTSMKVVMNEEKINLDEVVVVGIGYGTMRKKDLTGSISSVSSDKFTKGVITTSEQLIQGKMAGVTVMRTSGDPSVGATVRLRGGTSLTAGNSPLYVVDGVPGADINTISPSDIESIDVLKDASAAAIYGSRGANGVIIVTTKKAKEGQAKTEYSTYAAVSQSAKNYDMLSANQWREYVRKKNIVGAVDYGANTDWQKEIQRTAYTQYHNLSMDGSGNNLSYHASLNYLDNQGIVIENYLKRLGGSITVNHKTLNNKLNLDFNISSNFDKYRPTDAFVFQRTLNLNPTIPVYNPDGSFTEIEGLNYENPVAYIKNRSQEETRNRFLGYIKSDLELIQGFHWITNVSYNLGKHDYSFYVNSLDRIEGSSVKGRGQKATDEYSNQQLETYLTFDKSFGDHSLGLMGGYSYLYNMYQGFGAVRRGFSTDLFLYNNLAAGLDYRQGDVYSYKGDSKLISFFGRLNYNYQSKYYLTGTLRRDGSSKFGKNNKWGVFPSASASWRVSAESFMEPLRNVLTNLKLRVGYGVTGNQEGIPSYKSIMLLGQSSDDPQGYTYFTYDGTAGKWLTAYGIIQNANPDLKWEQTAQTNIGIDASLYNRINITLDYYMKYTSDLLFTYAVPQPPYLYGKMLANVGNLSNNGIELTVNAAIIQTKDFSWNVDVNFATNTQKIDKLSNQLYTTDAVPAGLLTGIRGMSGVQAQLIKEGYVAGTFYGLVCDSISSTGKYVYHDFDGDGKISDKDKTVIGDVQPDYTAGLSMSFTYKQFDFGFSFYGIFGQDLLNASYMSVMDDSRFPTYNVPDAAMTDKLTAPADYSSYWIEDGSFVRLQNVSLGYTLPIKPNSWVKRARVYLNAENLFVITKYSGLDPEINLDGLDFPGIEVFNAYPKPRTYSLGLNITF